MSVVALVRDGKTGEIILKPPSEQTWLARTKEGLGRAVKQEYTVTESVDQELLEMMDQARKWSVGFQEYYDVYVWDLTPGMSIRNIIEEVIRV